MFCDQEGTAGMVFQENFNDKDWHEHDTGNAMQKRRIQELQTAEVKAACEGLLAAGATEIVINDALGGGYHILFEQLSGPIRIIHGVPKQAECWMSRLDSSFAALCYIGGHPQAGTPKGIIPHTQWIINDGTITLGEVGMAMSLAGYFGVPTVAVSGDLAVEKESTQLGSGGGSGGSKRSFCSADGYRAYPGKRSEIDLHSVQTRSGKSEKNSAVSHTGSSLQSHVCR